MDSASIAMIAAMLLMVVMSAYFSATETAFSSLNRVRLKSKADAGDSRAALALSMDGGLWPHGLHGGAHCRGADLWGDFSQKPGQGVP